MLHIFFFFFVLLNLKNVKYIVALESLFELLLVKRKRNSSVKRSLLLDEAVSGQDVGPPERVPLHRRGLRHQRSSADLAGRRRYLLRQLAGRDHGVLRGGRVVGRVGDRLADLPVPQNDPVDARIELLGRSGALLVPRTLPVGLALEGPRDPEIPDRTLARGRRGRDNGLLAEGAAVSAHVHVDPRPAALQVVQLLVPEARQLRRIQQDALVVVGVEGGVEAVIRAQTHVPHTENRVRDHLGMRITVVRRLLLIGLLLLLLLQHRAHQTLQIRGVHLVGALQFDLEESASETEN